LPAISFLFHDGTTAIWTYDGALAVTNRDADLALLIAAGLVKAVT